MYTIGPNINDPTLGTRGFFLACDEEHVSHRPTRFPTRLQPTFGGRCNRYFWDIRLKNSQVTYFYYALSPCANTIFQKLTVFVYTESWSRDQVMKRAYYFNVVLTIQCPFSWYITIGFVSFLCLFNLPLLYESPSSAGHKKNFICSMLSGKDLSLSNTH